MEDIEIIGEKAHRIAEVGGRSQVSIEDIAEAFDQTGLKWADLESFSRDHFLEASGQNQRLSFSLILSPLIFF